MNIKFVNVAIVEDKVVYNQVFKKFRKLMKKGFCTPADILSCLNGVDLPCTGQVGYQPWDIPNQKWKNQTRNNLPSDTNFVLCLEHPNGQGMIFPMTLPNPNAPVWYGTMDDVIKIN
jgi:hypothetical protein